MQNIRPMMKVAIFGTLLLASLGSSSLVQENDPKGVESVIVLLKKLIIKSEQDLRDETATYNRFHLWCEVTKLTLEKTMLTEHQTIEDSETKIAANVLRDAGLLTQIQGLTTEINRNFAAELENTKDRRIAAGLYQLTDQELADTIDALYAAANSLKTSDQAIRNRTKDASNSNLLAQKSILKLVQMPQVMTQLTEEQQKQLTGAASFVQVSQEPADTSNAAATKYDEFTSKYVFKSDKVVDLLEDLAEKFMDQRLDGTKKETQSQTDYALTQDQLDQQIEQDSDTRNIKTNIDGSVRTEIASDSQVRDATTIQYDANKMSLKEVRTACDTKQAEWSERQIIRKHETEALTEAVRILTKVTGVSAPAVSFLQIEDPKQNVVNLLRAKAKAGHYKALDTLAQELQSKLGGPFDDLNNMLMKMILRLMSEQKDEDDHKAWCDLELSKTNTSQIDKQEKIALIQAKTAADNAAAVAMDKDIESIGAAITKSQESIAELKNIREESSAENSKAMKDAQDAQAALLQAQDILTRFYVKTNVISSFRFMQESKNPHKIALVRSTTTDRGSIPLSPEIWASSYAGIADPENQPDGIISILKATSADYARLEAESRSQEQMDKMSYEEQLKLFKIEIDRKTKETSLKEEEKNRLLEKVSNGQTQYNHARSELKAINDYLEDLQPACVEGDSTYEERKAARASEIAAVKEAQVLIAKAFKGEAAPAPAVEPAPAQATGFLSAKTVRRVQ